MLGAQHKKKPARTFRAGFFQATNELLTRATNATKLIHRFVAERDGTHFILLAG